MEQPGLEVVERFKERICAHWHAARQQHPDDLAALIVFDGGEHRLMIGPRLDMVRAMEADGADFSNIPQLQRPANEGTPVPSSAIWVLVALDTLEGETATGIAITRFVEPLAGTSGGSS